MKWSQATKLMTAAALVALLAGCAATTIDSSWKAPGLTSLDYKGKKVAAVVISSNEGARRVAEDALAAEITAHGAVGVPGYTVLPNDAITDTTRSKQLLLDAGIDGVVIIRVTGKDQNTIVEPGYWSGPYYGTWGGYWGGGWGAAYSPGYVETYTVISAETLLYSIRENRLLWAGLSKTDSPEKLDDFVRDISDAVAAKLQEEGLIGKK